MDTDKALRDLNYIKEIVSSARYTNLSGAAGIIAGVFASAGFVLTWLLLKDVWISSNSTFMKIAENRMGELAVIWGAVFVLSGLVQAAFTIRKAKASHISVWSKVSRQVLYAVIPGFLAGAVLTVYFIKERNYFILPSVWMLTYGVAVSASGMFSVAVVRLLGWAFVISSLLPFLLIPESSILAMAVSFGGYHIIYGIIVAKKYGG
ncbi:MAG: hypothetical protein HZA48_05510 [Planctomycetes bacterium]|nr:hypothetical protein [Planctomycetota bacterium]